MSFLLKNYNNTVYCVLFRYDYDQVHTWPKICIPGRPNAICSQCFLGYSRLQWLWLKAILNEYGPNTMNQGVSHLQVPYLYLFQWLQKVTVNVSEVSRPNAHVFRACIFFL